MHATVYGAGVATANMEPQMCFKEQVENNSRCGDRCACQQACRRLHSRHRNAQGRGARKSQCVPEACSAQKVCFVLLLAICALIVLGPVLSVLLFFD